MRQLTGTSKTFRWEDNTGWNMVQVPSDAIFIATQAEKGEYGWKHKLYIREKNQDKNMVFELTRDIYIKINEWIKTLDIE